MLRSLSNSIIIPTFDFAKMGYSVGAGLLVVLLSALSVRADTPANCTFEDVKGTWTLYETARIGDSSIDCMNNSNRFCLYFNGSYVYNCVLPAYNPVPLDLEEPDLG